MGAFPERVTLGRSGLSVGPLAMSGGYGADKASLLKAFDHGVNYWYHGSRRAPGMTDAIRELVAAGKRDELAIVLQSYSRSGLLMEKTFAMGLRKLKIDHADVLLLGWYNHGAPAGVLEAALRMREKGMFKALSVSCHHRPSFVDYAKTRDYDILQIRYNAVHTGAERDTFPPMKDALAAAGLERPGTVAYTATRWGSLLDPKAVPDGETPLRGRDCYRFALSNPDIDVCMSGPSDAAQVDEALMALKYGPISTDEDERFRRIGQYIHDHDKSVRSFWAGN